LTLDHHNRSVLCITCGYVYNLFLFQSHFQRCKNLTAAGCEYRFFPTDDNRQAPQKKGGKPMKNWNSNLRILTALAVMIGLAAMLTGCASTTQVQVAQDQADLALQEAKAAMQAAQTAKSMAAERNMDAEEAAQRAEMAANRAEQAARRAEAAATKAEEMANKAEKIFMQQMKK
jgi:hypothetical protein